MKKRFTALLTALLCLTATISAAPANAVDAEVDIETTYTFSTDAFTYTSNTPWGFLLESEVSEPDFMVVGRCYLNGELFGYVVSPVNAEVGMYTGTCSLQTITEELGSPELKIGDLLKVDGEVYSTLTYPPSYVLGEEGTMSYLGNGIDIFGEEFEKVIRLQLVIDQATYEFEKQYLGESYEINLLKGDVTVDDTLTIADCLAINKNLLAGEPLCDYAKLAADINGNGAPDAADSLSILKEVLHITENFE